ncbi:GDP-fucose protein O-fucosyltransferase 2-like isoform X1 [Pecten maximus]|uniref:GDP-fucose protein O-fucosyltransferase 2-like isoform X1 n=1 Tax=Pecten maximus TaxID=6579 RepID=UPI0014585D67|nr:GDP-fucose protein O-fucosyltransferase 2-like isoform X1 [Pecten maximus]
MNIWTVLHVLFVIACIDLRFTECKTKQDSAFDVGVNDAPEFKESKPVRYLLYNVNPGEGFNLRRDVYIRVANLVKLLNDDEPWALVLPPWGRIYHWQTREISQIKLPWSLFFDLESLRRHIPVLEFEEFLAVSEKPVIDEIYYLQRYKEGWTKWEEKMDILECLEKHGYSKGKDGRWHHWFFGYGDDVYANKFECMSYMGHAGFIKPFLMHNISGSRSVFLDRAESLIHGQYSEWSPLYWSGRRSMVYAKHLRDIGDNFREKYLGSTDKKDKTVLDDWTKMKKKHGDAKGGPYLAIHLRRKDYLYAHGGEIPSIQLVPKKVKSILKKHKLKKVFIATDAPNEEYEYLKQEFGEKVEVYRFKPTPEEHEKYKDGGVAIIDQWICAHARYFIGSYVSTFSFRIQEEREILGFEPEMTFNRLCNDDSDTCEQPSKWTIKY